MGKCTGGWDDQNPDSPSPRLKAANRDLIVTEEGNLQYLHRVPMRVGSAAHLREVVAQVP